MTSCWRRGFGNEEEEKQQQDEAEEKKKTKKKYGGEEVVDETDEKENSFVLLEILTLITETRYPNILSTCSSTSPQTHE